MKAILAGALETGLGTVLSNVTVFVENGKIADIAEGLDPRNADEVIDASDMIVTPGSSTPTPIWAPTAKASPRAWPTPTTW